MPGASVRLISFAATIGILAAATSGGSAAGGSSPALRAYLGSQRIPLRDVARYHCHDLEYPILRCYVRGVDAARAVARSGRRLRMTVGGDTLAGLNYVRIFEHASFGGQSAYLSASYPELGVIGWNDKISSYAVVNSGTGSFHEHIYNGGVATTFCCNASVSNVGSSLNDTFSSASGSA